MARKVFISVLGTGTYEKCRYVKEYVKEDVKEKFTSSDTHFIQQATLEYLLRQEEWSHTDTALILLTERAKTCNWQRSIESRRRPDGQEVAYTGLENILEQAALPFEVQPVNIPDGKDEKEMWEIFSRLFSQLQDGDRLYFDLTHSFRYLPMLVLVLGNYTKFLKNARVCHISYGNYEARDRDTNEAPIVDLLPLSLLQDWTFASADYLENGNAKRLTELCKSTVAPVLKATKGKDTNAQLLRQFAESLNLVIQERQTCRGISLVESHSVRKLKEIVRNISPDNLEIKPLNPVFEKISDSLNDFDEEENVENGFAAARWCLDNGLYQQAITIFHENIVTYICKQNELDWKDKAHRTDVGKALQIRIKNFEEKDWKLEGKDHGAKEENRGIIRELLTRPVISGIATLYNQMNELRNDINHSGMRSNAQSAGSIERDSRELMRQIQEKLQTEYPLC